MANKIGCPPKYQTPEELQARINDYFEHGMAYREVIIGPANNRTIEKIAVPTITGLVLHCGFCDRKAFYDYEKKPEFSNTIKAARTRIEQNYEELIQCGSGAGAIFALKNFGWVDKTEIDHNVKETLYVENEGKSIEQLQRESIELARKIVADRSGAAVSAAN